MLFHIFDGSGHERQAAQLVHLVEELFLRGAQPSLRSFALDGQETPTGQDADDIRRARWRTAKHPPSSARILEDMRAAVGAPGQDAVPGQPIQDGALDI